VLNYSVVTAMPLATQTSCDTEPSVPQTFTRCCKMWPYHSSGTKVMASHHRGQGSIPAPVFHCHYHSTNSPHSFIHLSIHPSIHPTTTEATEYQQFTASLNSTNSAKPRLKAKITLALRGLVHPSQRLAPLVSRCE